MSAMRKGRGSTSFQDKQSDNDFQRHNADRHYREGSGQDRLQQRFAHKDRPEALYTVAGQMTRREGSYSCGALGGTGLNTKNGSM